MNLETHHHYLFLIKITTPVFKCLYSVGAGGRNLCTYRSPAHYLSTCLPIFLDPCYLVNFWKNYLPRFQEKDGSLYIFCRILLREIGKKDAAYAYIDQGCTLGRFSKPTAAWRFLNTKILKFVFVSRMRHNPKLGFHHRDLSPRLRQVWK